MNQAQEKNIGQADRAPTWDSKISIMIHQGNIERKTAGLSLTFQQKSRLNTNCSTTNTGNSLNNNNRPRKLLNINKIQLSVVVSGLQPPQSHKTRSGEHSRCSFLLTKAWELKVEMAVQNQEQRK